MNRPPKLRTPDHTQLNLVQEKYYRPFIDGYIKVLQSNLKQVKHIGNDYSYTTYTCGEPHDHRNPNWKPFRLLWGIVSGPVMIFMWSGISYFSESVINWFVNVRGCRTMKSAGGWNWSVYLDWILVNREKGDWSWFSFEFGLLYWSG
jgi:hypothetical protein